MRTTWRRLVSRSTLQSRHPTAAEEGRNRTCLSPKCIYTVTIACV
jgi:hypothetical protein